MPRGAGVPSPLPSAVEFTTGGATKLPLWHIAEDGKRPDGSGGVRQARQTSGGSGSIALCSAPAGRGEPEATLLIDGHAPLRVRRHPAGYRESLPFEPRVRLGRPECRRALM